MTEAWQLAMEAMGYSKVLLRRPDEIGVIANELALALAL